MIHLILKHKGKIAKLWSGEDTIMAVDLFKKLANSGVDEVTLQAPVDTELDLPGQEIVEFAVYKSSRKKSK